MKNQNFLSIFTFLSVISIFSLTINSCNSEEVETNKSSDIVGPLTQTDPCCEVKYPAIQAEISGVDLFQKQFKLIAFRDTSTGNFKYKLQHSPSVNYENVSQAYVNYVKALYPCISDTGSTWRLSKGNWGPGHTTRQITRENWIGFTPGSLTSTMSIVAPNNFWTDYFEPPITIGAAATPAVNGGLYVNEIYAIEYGFWVNDSNCNFPQQKKDCFTYHKTLNFKIQASTNPIHKSYKHLTKVIFLDSKNNIIETREIETIIKK